MKAVDKQKLWDQYCKNPTPALREQLIIEYAPLVKLVAGRLNMYLGNNVEFDDLCGYGIFGLIDAIDKFDAFKDVKFETYASLRIRGAILDQIRKMDWIPRTIRKRQRQIDQVMNDIQAREGREATDEEIAGGLGISAEEYLDWQTQMKVTGVVSLNEYLETGSDIANESRPATSIDFQQPEKVLEKAELKEMLVEALELLSEKEKTVITFYYYEEMTLKEISRVLEVSESRVSQLHTRALAKMKKKMGNYMGILHDRA